MTDKVKTTELQQALINAGLTDYQFHNNGTDYHVPVADLPDTTLVRLARYGTRLFNDVANSTAHRSDKAKGTICKELIAKFKSGEVSTGGGRTRISSLERALRAIVKTYLLKGGVDNKSATMLCKNPQDGFKRYLITKGVGKDKLESAFAKHWPTVQAKAQAFADLEDFDLD